MSQQEPDGEPTTDSPERPRYRQGIRRATELWLVAVGLWSTVGYGVRDAFSRRPAGGVILTKRLVAGVGGAVRRRGRAPPRAASSPPSPGTASSG